ncbi:trinucleotide repeat-containing gene 6C protein isoform X3 [Chelonus insularis]|uniref:trinucleotide repeat-containing gene 6C protein isoform X3 n=1 Tax=Chelonus insularis TaxID=460826 RepID=UPI00158C3D51|nr:trinucleotide repeat-containing gene 6C protein isoform X3 [Chelonus insularis]
MFPHNFSSHEISTKTNAFVQNSKGDVVVLEESSLSGAREGERPEHARYCDIKFINSSMKAAPTSHPKATVANDFITVLPRQFGELSFAVGGEACQSVATETTKNSTTNHLLTYDNNDNIIINNNYNHNNAEHNHHKYRKQNTTRGSLGQLGSSADKSKFMSKPLSDNKDSFSNVSVRVLKLSLHIKDKMCDARRPAGVASLVRIPKSDRPQRQPCLANIVDNYFLLGSRLNQGDNNNLKANLSLISNNNSKSVILLSSTSYGDYYLLVAGDGFARQQDLNTYIIFVGSNNDNDNCNGLKNVKLLGDKYSLVTMCDDGEVIGQLVSLLSWSLGFTSNQLFIIIINSDVHFNWPTSPALLLSLLSSSAQKFTAQYNACSSITLIVSKNEIIDHTLQFFLINNLIEELRAISLNTTTTIITTITTISQLFWHVTVSKLMQRICVPLLIKNKVYDNYNVGNNYYYYYYYYYYYIDDSRINDKDKKEIKNIRYNNNNPDVIQDIVNVAVCYKTSCVMTTNIISMLGSQNDGISCTEATIFTVGALSFQDNYKSNKPLNNSYKNYKYQVSTKVGHESNFNIKSVSMFTPSDKSSDKSEETSHQARLDVNYDDDGVECVTSPVNIPTLTTCEPMMTLNSQSATVTSQTNSVPVSRANIEINNNNYSNDNTLTVQSVLIANDNHQCSSDESILDDHPLPTNGHQHQQYLNSSQSVNTKTNTASMPDTRSWEKLITYVRILTSAFLKAYKNNESDCENQRNELKKALNCLFAEKTCASQYYHQHQNYYHDTPTYNDPIMDYKRRWGIPMILSLAGGGESSLNNGASSNWGSAPATTPNNNNANQSGWGGTPGNAPPSSANWGNNNVNRTGNPNQNPNQGPPSNQANSANTNKTNNPNQSSNSQSGPPASQPPNQNNQTNQNNTQWTQGKSNTSGQSQNPSASNNNGNTTSQTSNSTSNNNSVSNTSTGSVSASSPPSTNPSTKQQLEQLNTIREALFSQDGWGCQHVNQDSNWDVPTSPEPSISKDGVPLWKPPVNNGTDLWDATLRNGGQPQPPQQAKTPWGHTPSTNIGGTWGEDDEVVDSSNMWTGTPAPTQPNTAQWPGATSNQTGSSWGDPRIDSRDPRDLRSVDPREMRDPRDHRMSLDPREHIRVLDPMTRDPRMTDMRGDPRGISGRLNGASADAMWGPPGPPHHQMSHQHPSGPPTKMLNPSSMNQWSAPPPKEMMPGKQTGWEEPSPPAQRRNVPNYDDGTSLWGNPTANQRAMPSGKVSHWKDIPANNLGRGGMQCPPGMPQNRMPGQPTMKPDVGGPMWGHPSGPGGRNGSWGEGPHEGTNWDDPKTPGSWNEPPLNPASWAGPSAHKPKAMGPSSSWGEADMEPGPSWPNPTKPALTKEVIWNSREFRYLCDLGYKKEDVETALRNREMNKDEAQELLSQLRGLDQWRRHEAPSGYDPTSQQMSSAYPKFSHVAQQMSFPPGAGVPSGAATGSVSGSVASASLLKLQQQQQQQQTAVPMQQQPNANPPQPPFNQASRTPQNPPSAQQLRMLVQQIQLAVQEGYLNQQILNQPLAPSTLFLLNQLLQQIKVLQQLHQQHSVQSSLKGNGQHVLQISVQITKTKQQIANLQNQIAVQQATYMKQQQHPAAPSQSSDYYKTSVHDPMSALQNSFSDLTMNKEPPVVFDNSQSQQQSRLNQWKLPSLDKDSDMGGNEFSRAPGSTSKPPPTPGSLSHSHSSPNMNPLLGQSDGTWSTRLGDSGWPDAGNNDATDGKDWQPPNPAFTDLVPEFEPGKPWKGTQMKNIEDDPSITPGSVVRSLSLAAIKDPDAIFSSSSKTSPPPAQNVDATTIPSLSSSTWSFNPPATTPSTFASSKNTWTDSAPPPTAVTSELWGAPINKARQGPPPGLSSKGAVGNTSNGWTGLGVSSRPSNSNWLTLHSAASNNSGWLVAGTWLLLKNLTPQIDGSTLKTLCMQHGPVQDFRLYLNHGIAFTKYSSRDEANKAQLALNNCVLGNTTIFAESPTDSEVHTLLQQLSHGGQQQTGASGGNGWGLRPSNKAGPPPDTWGGSSSQLWSAPLPSSNSLWSNSGLDSGDAQRTTPSSLNSYLPENLLGGESM